MTHSNFFLPTRKKGMSSKQTESKQVSKAMPAPDANAEKLQKLKEQNKQRSINPDEDAAGFRINRNGGMSSSRSPPRKEMRKQRSFVQSRAAQLIRCSNSVAARDGSHFAIANPRWSEDSFNNNNRRKNDGDWSQRLVVKPKDFTKEKEAILGGKAERMHYSGPLVSGRENLEEMLREHERQIQVAVRKARADKKTKK